MFLYMFFFKQKKKKIFYAFKRVLRTDAKMHYTLNKYNNSWIKLIKMSEEIKLLKCSKSYIKILKTEQFDFKLHS